MLIDCLEKFVELRVVIFMLVYKIQVLFNPQRIILIFDSFNGFVKNCVILVRSPGSHDVKAHVFDYFLNTLIPTYILDFSNFYL